MSSRGPLPSQAMGPSPYAGVRKCLFQTTGTLTYGYRARQINQEKKVNKFERSDSKSPLRERRFRGEVT